MRLLDLSRTVAWPQAPVRTPPKVICVVTKLNNGIEGFDEDSDRVEKGKWRVVAFERKKVGD